jgi:16S rRNA (cytidine1402-2'-O)-methyltransferase
VTLVGTPIGNLADLSARAAAALAAADVVFCEDTRRTRRLFSAAGIPAPRLVASHQHNEAATAARAVELARGGAAVAVVTDAGMPGISDPGARMVAAGIAAEVPVHVVPGPTALVSALVASGLPAERFCFEGFLPRKGRDRRDRLVEIARETRTTVLYEAPHRIGRTVADLVEACGPDRPVALARELTKLHEEVWRGRLGGAVERVTTGEARGEWVVVVGGLPAPDRPEPAEADIEAALRERVSTGTSTRDAVTEVAAELGLARRAVYRVAVGLDADRG